MAETMYLVSNNQLSSIGNSIRSKLGESTTYTVDEMPSKISSISGSSGSSLNTQAYNGYATVTAASYTTTKVSLTVSKSSYYNISWMGFRNTTSGTSGSRLYINGSAVGSEYTTFVNSYGQYVNFSMDLNQGDVLTVYARARSTSYVMGVGNLIIEEVGVM